MATRLNGMQLGWLSYRLVAFRPCHTTGLAASIISSQNNVTIKNTKINPKPVIINLLNYYVHIQKNFPETPHGHGSTLIKECNFHTLNTGIFIYSLPVSH